MFVVICISLFHSCQHLSGRGPRTTIYGLMVMRLPRLRPILQSIEEMPDEEEAAEREQQLEAERRAGERAVLARQLQWEREWELEWEREVDRDVERQRANDHDEFELEEDREARLEAARVLLARIDSQRHNPQRAPTPENYGVEELDDDDEEDDPHQMAPLSSSRTLHHR